MKKTDNINYNNIYDNKFNITTDSLDVVGFSNTTIENISKEEINNDN